MRARPGWATPAREGGFPWSSLPFTAISGAALGSWAVRLTAGFSVAFAAAFALFAAAYAVGRQAATADNRVGVLVATLGSLGLLGSLVAFVLAIIAKIERER